MDLDCQSRGSSESNGNHGNSRSGKHLPGPVLSFSRSHDRSHMRLLLGESPRYAAGPAADVASAAEAVQPATPPATLRHTATSPADLLDMVAPDVPPDHAHTTWL